MFKIVDVLYRACPIKDLTSYIAHYHFVARSHGSGTCPRKVLSSSIKLVSGLRSLATKSVLNSVSRIVKGRCLPVGVLRASHISDTRLGHVTNGESAGPPNGGLGTPAVELVVVSGERSETCRQHAG